MYSRHEIPKENADKDETRWVSLQNYVAISFISLYTVYCRLLLKGSVWNRPKSCLFYYWTFLHFKCYPLSRFLLQNPHPIIPLPRSMRVLLHRPTHSHLTALSFPYTGESEPSLNPGPLLPLMPDNAILCYLYGWSHGSLHVCSLVGGLVPGSSGGSGGLILLLIGL